MKLKVGMYVRTDKGFIQKILEIDKTLKYQNEDRLIINSEEWFLVESDLTKASHNIIDLIEEGDYVNGVMVESMNNSIKPKTIPQYKNEYGEYVDFDESDIKSIVTKEQFESMSYKIER